MGTLSNGKNNRGKLMVLRNHRNKANVRVKAPYEITNIHKQLGNNRFVRPDKGK
jgi:hypothetical protein